MEKKYKLSRLLSEHWIAVWVIASILYALVIHVLFSFTSNNRFIFAHWGAGDILTYASTVSLGLLALWQNKRIQEENDRAQEKLIALIEKSNEAGIISKIIEHEERRIVDLEIEMDAFIQNCDPQALAMTLKAENKITFLTDITELERSIDKNFFVIGRLLAEDKNLKKNDDHPLKKTYSDIFILIKNIIADIRSEKLDIFDVKQMENTATVLGTARNVFLSEKEKYIGEQRQRISRLLFDNLTLDEVRKLF